MCVGVCVTPSAQPLTETGTSVAVYTGQSTEGPSESFCFFRWEPQTVGEVAQRRRPAAPELLQPRICRCWTEGLVADTGSRVEGTHVGGRSHVVSALVGAPREKHVFDLHLSGTADLSVDDL